MPCRFVMHEDGRRSIMCSRFEHKPRFRVKADAIESRSPWRVGATVEHARRGRGVIVQRTQFDVTVDFMEAPGIERTFKLALVGNALRVAEPAHV